MKVQPVPARVEITIRNTDGSKQELIVDQPWDTSYEVHREAGYAHHLLLRVYLRDSDTKVHMIETPAPLDS